MLTWYVVGCLKAGCVGGDVLTTRDSSRLLFVGGFEELRPLDVDVVVESLGLGRAYGFMLNRCDVPGGCT